MGKREELMALLHLLGFDKLTNKPVGCSFETYVLRIAYRTLKPIILELIVYQKRVHVYEKHRFDLSDGSHTWRKFPHGAGPTETGTTEWAIRWVKDNAKRIEADAIAHAGQINHGEEPF